MTNSGSLLCSSVDFAGLSTDILRSGKSLSFTAHGVSMRPLLRDGDILKIEAIRDGRLRIGEIVFCRTLEGHIVVHRVVGRQLYDGKKYYLVQGDQVGNPDGLIPFEQLFGRVISVERAGQVFYTGSAAMRLLGLFAVLRSRTRSGYCWWRVPVQLARKLPLFYQYLL